MNITRGLVRRTGAIVAVAALGLALGACTIGQVRGATDPAAGQSAEAEPNYPAPEVSVEDGATEVSPVEPVTVEAEAGLRALQLTNDAGKVVKGTFNDQMTSWTSAEPLGYGRTYTITGSDKAGNEIDRSFTTVVPAAQTSAYLGPIDGSEVGVAQAVTVRFSYPPADKDAAEKAIKVESSNDTEGGFYWQGDTELIWRPKEFWSPGTSVTVTADIYGRELGGGVYGADTSKISFTVGDEVLTTVDNATKTLTVTRNGEELGSFPISLGSDGKWATPNGTYVVGDKNESMTMDSRTYGLALDAGGYSTKVNYATQLSYSGIYVHAAPWAAGALGSYNQSHGCINASTEDAKWYMNTVKRGDPVKVINSDGDTLPGWDGLGYWNLGWDELDSES